MVRYQAGHPGASDHPGRVLVADTQAMAGAMTSCLSALIAIGMCIATVSVSAYSNETGAPPYQGLTASGI